MTSRKQPKPAATLERGGPEARAEAMRLLAEGFTLTSVAEHLGMARCTVREWRDSPAGQIELAAARKAREASFADAVADAHRIVREALPRALQIIVDQLDDPDPAVASLAARTLADRGGVPRAQRIESAPESDIDLSLLSDAEFEQLRALRAKAHKARKAVG
jgi:hypothetical protein